MKTILVTGSAGFIGANLVLRLLDSKEPLRIVGLDNLNDYYDPSLKEYRLSVIDKAFSSLPAPTGHLRPPIGSGVTASLTPSITLAAASRKTCWTL